MMHPLGLDYFARLAHITQETSLFTRLLVYCKSISKDRNQQPEEEVHRAGYVGRGVERP